MTNRTGKQGAKWRTPAGVAELAAMGCTITPAPVMNPPYDEARRTKPDVRGSLLWRMFVEGGNEAADVYGKKTPAAYLIIGARLATLGLVQLVEIEGGPFQRWELTAAGVVAAAEDRLRLYRVVDGAEEHTATLLELWAANVSDRGFVRWLIAAGVGEAEGGFNSLRVERIR